jgi:hypothetical protein
MDATPTQDAYKATYQEHWRGIVENPDGTLNRDQVMRELHDFAWMMEQVALAYDDVTGGRFSKPNTAAEHVIAAVHDRIIEAARQTRQDALAELAIEHDLRYALKANVFAVMDYHDREKPRAVAATDELANEYVEGQWSDEYLSIHPVELIQYLPPKRPLYMLSGRLPYGSDAGPTRELDEIAAENGEFPGLGNGAIVPLDEINVRVEDGPRGWNVNVCGWDLDQVSAAFDQRMTEARAARADRTAAFNRFPQGTIVRWDGADNSWGLMRIRDHDSVPCWRAVTSGDLLYDFQVDPDTLSIVVHGEQPGAVS